MIESNNLQSLYLPFNLKKVVFTILIFLFTFEAFAQISNTTRNYSERTAMNLVGNFESIGNINQQCSGCAAGTQSNNGANMVFVDIDGVATTQNSSSAQLTIPAGSTVEWAGLYWGGVYNSSNGGVTNPSGMDIDQVKLMEPGATTYTTLNATTRNIQQSTTNSPAFSSWRTFLSFTEVTSIVQSAGSGNYYVADINLALGGHWTGTHGGWTLVVVYSNPAEQSRRINVWDGFRFFGFGASESFNVTGILTPSLGAFETKVAYYGMDGEASFGGDFININGTPLADATNPPSNVFNGTVAVFGANNANRNPNVTPYNWGYDLDIFDASGSVPNSATSVAVQLGSTFEGIWGGVFVISNQIVLPDINKGFTPSQVNNVGDVSTVSITIDNPIKGINITGGSLNDNLPPGMVIAPTPNASISCGGAITATAGSNTFTTSGMNIPIGTSCTINFDVVTTGFGNYINTITPSNFTNNQGVDLHNSSLATLTVGTFCSTSAISGTVYDDANGNGSNDSESGLSGVDVLIYEDTNTNGVIDVGTDVLLTTETTNGSGNYSYSSTSTSVISTEDFDPSGNVFGGGVSGTNWVNNSWIRSGANGNTGDVQAINPTDADDDIGGNLLQLDDNDAGAYRIVNLEGVSTATLTFDYDYDNAMDGGEQLLVQVDPENDGTYITLQTITATTNSPNPKISTGVLIPSANLGGANTRIRFITGSNNGINRNGENWWIDNIQIIATTNAIQGFLITTNPLTYPSNYLPTSAITLLTSLAEPTCSITGLDFGISNRADLSLTKTVNNSDPYQGDNITFTIILTNDGPLSANSIEIRDIIPTGFTYAHPNFVTSQGTATFNAGTRALTWDLGAAYDLTNGSSLTLTYTVTVDVCGEFKNQVEIVQSSQTDSDSTPNNGS